MLSVPFEKRRETAQRLQLKYPGMVLLIIESPDFVFQKTQFVVDPEKKIWEMMFDIKRMSGFSASEPMVAITYADIVAPSTWTMAELYSHYYSRDGFLYLRILKTDNGFG